MAYAADAPEIDINAITQTNPFAQFTQRQNAPAATAVAVEKPDLFVETATLKFFDAKSIKSSISSMSGDFGNIEPDSKSNALIICDTKENVEKILEQIRKIDRKPEQVMIEVVLLDVKLNDKMEVGVNWDMLTDDLANTATFRQNLGFSPRLQSTVGSIEGTDTTAATDNIGNATAWNTTGTGSDFWLINGDVRNVIHVLQEKTNVEIIASPRVMVVSGQTASIEAVEEIPYEQQSDTSNGGQLTSVQFKNVGVTLNVGATLTDDRFILLNVKAEQKVSTGVSGVSGVPIVDARIVQSALLLEDSQILVIGGLRRKETQKQTNQLPFLGDLPIVGLAFKATNNVENSSELLIILSPHIYTKNDKLTNDQMLKYKEITQKPLLTIPEVEENKKKAEAEKAKKAKAAKKIKKQSK
jgi:type IV pilus assembly protein PilQ